jgi:Tfp pilus assembly protein PilZ
MGPMASNRRQHPRVSAQGLAAHLRTAGGRIQCVVENISLGGLFVRTDRLQDVGAEISVDLVKPGWKRQLTLPARITSRVDALEGTLARRTPGMGIQFTQVDDVRHERLVSLLRELGASDEQDEITIPDEAVEAELRALDAGGPALPVHSVWQQVQMVEAAIESALEDSRPPPPGPLTLEPSLPQRVGPEPHPVSQLPGVADLAQENARLHLQLRGLVMQLSDAQQLVVERDAEIERLREELETIRAALARALKTV